MPQKVFCLKVEVLPFFTENEDSIRNRQGFILPAGTFFAAILNLIFLQECYCMNTRIRGIATGFNG